MGAEKVVISDFVDERLQGAGDAFCAGFLYGLIKGRDLYECGRLRNFVANRCILKVNARTGLPRFSDLQDM